MGIKKADLYKFVEDKFKARKLPIFVAVRNTADRVAIEVLTEQYPELVGIERQAHKLHEELQNVRAKYDRLANRWGLTSTVRDLNEHVVDLRATLADDFAGYAASNILKGTTSGLMPEFEARMPGIKLLHAKDINAYKELCKLERELLPIIDGCRSGDKAYAKLQELGVDLTGFDTGTPNLPAVIKLTVDVGLLNG